MSTETSAQAPVPAHTEIVRYGPRSTFRSALPNLQQGRPRGAKTIAYVNVLRVVGNKSLGRSSFWNVRHWIMCESACRTSGHPHEHEN